MCVLTKEGTNHYCLGLWGYLPGSTMHTHTHKQTTVQLKTYNWIIEQEQINYKTKAFLRKKYGLYDLSNRKFFRI